MMNRNEARASGVLGSAKMLIPSLLALALAGHGGGVEPAGRAAQVQAGGLLLKIPNPEPAERDLFGTSVVGTGRIIAVGANRDDIGAKDAGAVFLFDGDRASPTFGDHVFTLSNPTPDEDEFFGETLAISGSSLVVGERRALEDGVRAGKVHLFDIDASSPAFGALQLTIDNPTPEELDRFGEAILSTDDLIIVADPDDDIGSIRAGSVYLFGGVPADADYGRLLMTIPNPSPDSHDDFGQSLAAVGDRILISAPIKDASAEHSGVV